ncbi:MAG: DUF2851 family protein [Thermoproteota archaeon]|nr:DUF2851 family protein [Thermoproteota archaeon]
MNENLLQYIWKFQYFNKNELATTVDESLQIIHPGNFNTNQGPDFLAAKIKIGNTIWAGSIELHAKSSDWKLHKHSADKNYKNIILHVVWEDDANMNLSFPTLELQSRVSKLLLAKYEELMKASYFIPCEKMIYQADEIIWTSWKERLLAERLQNKSQIIFQYLNENNNHWEETFWWLIAKNFGIKVNSDAFEKIARSLSINILAKHKNQIHQTEAFLFGQAGFLENDPLAIGFKEDYPKLLQKEYRFLKAKYKLQPIKIPLHFLRMRPSNFPTVRLAQLAVLINQSLHLFSKIKESNSLKEVKDLLNVTANDYWHYHYMFDEPSSFKIKKLGDQMINNILINTIVPLLFAYGHVNNEALYKDKAIQWLEQIQAESNTITNGYTIIGIANKNAFDSQALIQLKNEYCNQKRCLECAIGNKIIAKAP